jgi:hypothetical protein
MGVWGKGKEKPFSKGFSFPFPQPIAAVLIRKARKLAND